MKDKVISCFHLLSMPLSIRFNDMNGQPTSLTKPLFICLLFVCLSVCFLFVCSIHLFFNFFSKLLQSLRTLANEMLLVMRAADGIGLAAPQVTIHTLSNFFHALFVPYSMQIRFLDECKLTNKSPLIEHKKSLNHNDQAFLL